MSVTMTILSPIRYFDIAPQAPGGGAAGGRKKKKKLHYSNKQTLMPQYISAEMDLLCNTFIRPEPLHQFNLTQFLKFNL